MTKAPTRNFKTSILRASLSCLAILAAVASFPQQLHGGILSPDPLTDGGSSKNDVVQGSSVAQAIATSDSGSAGRVRTVAGSGAFNAGDLTLAGVSIGGGYAPPPGGDGDETHDLMLGYSFFQILGWDESSASPIALFTLLRFGGSGFDWGSVTNNMLDYLQRLNSLAGTPAFGQFLTDTLPDSFILPAQSVWSAAYDAQTGSIVFLNAIGSVTYNASDISSFELSPSASLFSPGIASVPEPNSLVLAAFGLVGLAGWRRRRKR